MASPGKKSFLLRLPPELWDEIERLAARELRSSNAQIEYLLREALQRRGIRLETAPAAKRGRPPREPGSDETPENDKGEDR
ncbi:MAG TPA: hypothetical protein VK195_05735 [Burkholderiaceae bacterium]|nr:hypothetical protein [Burkholderiaceae bacterium]